MLRSHLHLYLILSSFSPTLTPPFITSIPSCLNVYKTHLSTVNSLSSFYNYFACEVASQLWVNVWRCVRQVRACLGDLICHPRGWPQTSHINNNLTQYSSCKTLNIAQDLSDSTSQICELFPCTISATNGCTMNQRLTPVVFRPLIHL